MRCPNEISVYLNGNRTNFTVYGIRPLRRTYEVAKITVHNFEFCSFYNDVALIELKGNISETLATPICMPSEDLELEDVLYAAGSGKDYSAPSTLIDPNRISRGQQVVAQKLYGVDEPLHQILTLTFAKTILPGDSGGPLFQVDGADVHTLVGINSALNSTGRPKADVGENMQAYYVDVRAYSDWICKYSGVCPIEDESTDEPPSGTSNCTHENFKNDKEIRGVLM
ncbi:hypothetical protein Aduo_009755 [Ancylostoma duodenale]